MSIFVCCELSLIMKSKVRLLIMKSKVLFGPDEQQMTVLGSLLEFTKQKLFLCVKSVLESAFATGIHHHIKTLTFIAAS